MKNTGLYIVLGSVILLIFFLQSCNKDVQLNRVPVIKLLSVSSDSLEEFRDSLTITLEYSDEDGDIGETDPDKNSLMIKDRRLANADFYFVKPLAPPDESLKIKGIIAVQVRNVFLLGTGSSEITAFDIKLRDRAGNWSNSVSTTSIIIHK